MSVEIREVTSKKELKKFVKFNIELYKGNPYHVPGLIEEEMMTLDKKKNPAFEVCDAIYFLAYKDGKVVGRIAGMVNHPSNEAWGQKRARFGFVDLYTGWRSREAFAYRRDREEEIRIEGAEVQER